MLPISLKLKLPKFQVFPFEDYLRSLMKVEIEKIYCRLPKVLSSFI
jgi:hypothetical protein